MKAKSRRAGARGIPALALAFALAESVCTRPDARSAGPRVIDDLEQAANWSPQPADGVELAVSSDSGHAGRALRLDFDFHGRGGYAVARRAIRLEVPENYEFSFWIRGHAPVNNLEFKLIDETGENVWWTNRRDFVFTDEWQQVRIKKRHITFAWGPLGGGDIETVAAIEFAITAGQGGRGTVWLDQLTLAELELAGPYTLAPSVSASSSAAGARPELALDADSATAWRAPNASPSWLAIDFLRRREFGGLILQWDSADYATEYRVEFSENGQEWRPAVTVTGGNGGRDYLYLPESDSRHVRLAFERSNGDHFAVRELQVMPLEWSASRNDFFSAVARDAPRGHYPRFLIGESSYWTVLGVNGDDREALLSEDGALEPFAGGFSIEPFLHDGRSLITWSESRTAHTLDAGYLPIPSVRRETDSLTLVVTAFVSGAPGASTLYARYRVENRRHQAQPIALFLAVRPFQVNPSYQFLNQPGGVTRIDRLAYDRQVVMVNGSERIVPIDVPTGFGAASFHEGGAIEALARGELPPARTAEDAFGHASGALGWSLDVPAGSVRDVHIAVPLHDGSSMPVPMPARATIGQFFEQRRAESARGWHELLDRVTVRLPPGQERITNTLRSNVAYILINRDGPAIQPGSRAYARSWIRDGALTSAALLRMGVSEPAREFVEWYAPFQYENGKVPCCVDGRGADPVPEHDSHGELIFAIGEYYRYTRDRAFAERMWPHVVRAGAYIDSLRHSRRTPEYDTEEKRAYRGLLPESISHEGYSAKPVHSYWDQFFALKGLTDAAMLAQALGREADAVRFTAMRDEFRRDLVASFQLTMAMHNIDYLPGSVELGDFDATSTTIGIAPGGALVDLPATAVQHTFDRYWRNFVERRDDQSAWEAYTPYELRVVGSFVRLNHPGRAHEALDFFFQHQRPAEWNQWAEVVRRDAREPGFIGDMPHTWVGSDYIRSVLDLFAFTDDRGTLVIGAGIPAEWVQRAPGVDVRGLRTYHGVLDFTMRATAGEVHVEIAGDMEIPANGILVRSPLPAPVRSASVDGLPAEVQGGIRVGRLPARVVIRY